MRSGFMKALSAMLAIVLLVGLFPTSVIAELLPDIVPDMNGDGVVNNIDEDIFATVQQGKVVPATPYNAGDAAGNFTDGVVYNQYSPYEPYETNDQDHPFLQGGSAWIDLSKLYYGAPATPNYPITKWSANTSVYNITGTGETYGDKGLGNEHPAYDDEIYALPDLNLIDEYLWKDDPVYVYKNYNDSGEHSDAIGKYDWVKEEGIAAVNDNRGPADSYHPDTLTSQLNTVTPKTTGGAAYVYNRFDAMQGKWGLTLDKHVSSVIWAPTYVGNYYGTLAPADRTSGHLNNTLLYLSDTPYLYYSTEALDSTQIAISLLIGAPVQTEKINTVGKSQTVVTDDNQGQWEFRWYTITDDAERPGISADTLDNSMVPKVYISDPVLEDFKLTDTLSDIIAAINNGFTDVDGNTVDGAPEKLDPIQNAVNENASNASFDADSLYVNGSITGCIDFTQLLPLVMGSVQLDKDAQGREIYTATINNVNYYYYKNGDVWTRKPVTGSVEESVSGIGSNGGGNFFMHENTVLTPQYSTDNGREDVCYKIAQIRVDTKTDTEKYPDAEESAARINYLYFGPGQSAVYTPQSTVGNEVSGGNWQYAQNDDNIGDENPNNVASNSTSSTTGHTPTTDNGYYVGGKQNFTYDSGYTNGWENGQAVSIINTPNNPQKITVDTYGDGNGQLLSYDQLTAEQKKKILPASTDSKIWVFTINGEEVLLEAERNELDAERTGGNKDSTDTEYYYIMVTVPIRKWVNVLGDSRKLSATISVEQAGIEGRNPGIVLWGNEAGAVGAGHSGSDFGARYRHEDLLVVLSDGYYHVDQGQNYVYAEVDATIGDSTIYNAPIANQTFYMYDTARQNVVTTDYEVYEDAAGVLYYKNGSTYYTKEQDVSTGGYPIYVLVDGNNNIYIHDTDRDIVLDGNDKEMVNPPSLDQLTPMYKFTAVAAEELPLLSRVCDTTESWFDVLRSPYLYESMIKGASAYTVGTNGIYSGFGYGAEMTGYTFVTSMRFTMPVGSKVSVQNMKGDGNSAGLNMYSTSGSIVDAYDGGAGVQPEIHIGNTLSTNTHVVDGGSGNEMNGTQSTVPAAYGPYLAFSNYTIHDLIERNRETNLTPIGRTYVMRTGVNIRPNPNSGDVMAVASTGSVIVVYAIAVDEANNHQYGLVGVLTSNSTTNPTSSFGWLPLRHSTFSSDEDHCTYERDQVGTGRVLEYRYTNQTEMLNSLNDLYTALYNDLIDNWVYSNFHDLKNDYVIGVSATENKVTRSPDSGVASSTPKGSDLLIASQHNTNTKKYMVTPMYANNADRVEGGTNTEAAMVNSTYNTWTNAVDWTFTSGGNNGIAFSRALSEPIRIKLGERNDSIPQLYYDFDLQSSDGSPTFSLAVTVKNSSDNIGVFYIPYADNPASNISKNQLTSAQSETWAPGTKTTYCGYVSFENILKHFGDTGSADSALDQEDYVDVLSVNIRAWKTLTCTMRRLEIVTEETDWLDDVNLTTVAENDYLLTTNKMVDSMNVINDAYFHYDLGTDGDAFKKQNSNKGWSSSITFHDGSSVDGSTIADSSRAEYRTALGHLRIKVPANGAATVEFESDRSFNAKNYKYLYYSYSMRDVDTGIAVDDGVITSDTGIVKSVGAGKGDNAQAGIEMVIKQGNSAWQEGNTGGVTYDTGNTYEYWNTAEGPTYESYFAYRPAMNAALDLSTFVDDQDLSTSPAINGFTFYLNNPYSVEAEYYINYIYLSNVPPSDLISDQLEETQYQYYYLMDNTGDRYSARFPTLDNPTGQITGGKNKTRVNPIRVERGDNFYEGTYNNGEPLGGSYGDKSGTTDQYYENTYGDPASTDQAVLDQLKEYLGVVDTDSWYSYIRMYWFYGAQDEENPNRDIQDYYRYKDRDGNGVGNKYDMLWSYGRWYTGAGESALNTMYIEEAGTGAQQADYIYGNLVRRYATENYVLLRSGIEPKKDLTYYNTDGGQMHYAASGTELGTSESISVNEHDKSYFITETVLFDYFSWPVENSAPVNPTKYGYVFDGWYFTELLPSAWTDKNKNGIYDYGEMKEGIWTDTDGDMIPDAGEILSSDYWTDLDGDGTFDFEMELQTFTKKQTPGANYFYAKWTADPTFTVDGKRLSYTANFLNAANESWLERTTDEDFQIRLPSVVQMNTAGGVRMVAGWKAYGVKADGTEVAYTTLDLATGKTYTPVYESGSWITLKLKDTDYVSMNFKPVLKDPETDDETGETAGLIGTITVTNGQLWLYTGTGDAANGYGKNDPNNQKIFHTTDDSTNTRTYYNVPKNVVFVAEPTITKEQDKSYGWVMSNPQDGKTLQLDTTLRAVLSTTDEYLFTASNLTMALSYDVLSTKEITESATGMVTTFTGVKPVNREMTFYSQYQELEGYTVEAFGTLYVRGSKNYTTIQTMLTCYLKLKETDLTADNVLLGSYETAHSAVRHIKASGSNTSDQYGLSYTDTTYKETTVYMRGYVIYSQEVNGVKSYHVKYSNYIIAGTVAADDSDTSEAA